MPVKFFYEIFKYMCEMSPINNSSASSDIVFLLMTFICFRFTQLKMILDEQKVVTAYDSFGPV